MRAILGDKAAFLVDSGKVPRCRCEIKIAFKWKTTAFSTRNIGQCLARNASPFLGIVDLVRFESYHNQVSGSETLRAKEEDPPRTTAPLLQQGVTFMSSQLDLLLLRKENVRRRRRQDRRGTTTVEAALVLPIFFTFVFGTMVLCHILFTYSLMQTICRNAARYGATSEVSTADLRAYIQDNVGAGIGDHRIDCVDILIKNAEVYDTGGPYPDPGADFNDLPDIELETAPSRQMFVVRLELMYEDIAILTLPYFDNLLLATYCFARHE